MHLRSASVVAILAGLACFAPPVGAQTSPAERAIEQATLAIASAPERVDGHNALAIALARRARETADPAFYRQAEAALARAFELAPGNGDAERIAVFVLLGQHAFEAARERALALAARVPDDALVQGLLVDANMELGRYDEAEQAAQTMIDMRPGSIPALTRAAYVREIIGDVDGAIDLMEQAFRRVHDAESEDRAWILVQLAHLRLANGDRTSADALADEALRAFPGYHYALAQRATIREAQRRPLEAATLWRGLHARQPHPEYLYRLGVALQQAGRRGEARDAFVRFERAARAEMHRTDNANRELALFYANGGRGREALAVASLEAARRADVQTLDAHAWALHAVGRHAEAAEVVGRALAVGVRDPAIVAHALAIAERTGDRAAARRHRETLARVAAWMPEATRPAGRLARIAGVAHPAAEAGLPPAPLSR